MPKKTNRSESYAAKKSVDLLTVLDAEISKNATAGKTLYAEGSDKKEQRVLRP